MQKVRFSTSQINGQSVVPRINLIVRINKLSSGIEITFIEQAGTVLRVHITELLCQ